ncbi:MAG: TIGR00341 family protein [Muribaculaceae bacterium]|nr:TIGR00341 family protein [Muribaculaceae bacterium]
MDALNKLKKLFVNYFDLSSYLIPQERAEIEIRESISFRGPNIIILILAILIASLGLNTNSTAVIIGAMLISPLMGPIIGIGLGVGIYDFELIKRSARNLAMAAGFSVIASTLYFLISPVNEGHSELLARTSPSIYDVLIGFVGGGAGILAIGSKSKGNVIPGVAIATALMPPLCTAGYGLATAQLHYFIGAFYLFIINSIYIAFATTIGVKLMKYRPRNFIDSRRAGKVRRMVYSLVIITMIPSIFLTYSMIRENRFNTLTEKFISQEFHFPATQVLNYKAQILNGKKSITVTLIGRTLPNDSLRLAMMSRLQQFGLAGTELNIIQGESASTGNLTPDKLSSTMLKDIYQITQATINRQQSTIDSLRYACSRYNEYDTISSTISPEIRILFPQIDEIAITKAVFSNTAGKAIQDTLDIALVKFSSAMPPPARKKFSEYLNARLNMNNINIIDIGTSIPFNDNR